MKNFEENLQKLETLSADIKRGDITLEEALKDFEEGIKLARGMEKELDSIESKIQVLMNSPELADDGAAEASDGAESGSRAKAARKKTEPLNSPALDLFDGSTELNGTRNA